ncbi:MAG: hypothetical protein ACYTG1_06955 [Planctomycetota bacterium]|jgi:hypothetical protein
MAARSRVPVAVLVGVLAAAAGPPGCAASPEPVAAEPPPPPPPATAPPDFALELTVTADPTGAAERRAHLRSGRFLLFADGSLHFAPTAAAEGAVPPRVRTLRSSQVDALWSRVTALDLVVGRPLEIADVVPPSTGRVAYRLDVAGDGRRWSRRRAGPLAEPDPGLADLARRLAALAWVSDTVPARAVLPPRRYDFGPDPYARFRRP